MTLHSTRHLEIILALAEHRHFGRAAKALGVSQPSLTRSLKLLEEALGVRLFDRGTQSVTPTLFGRIVVDRGGALIGGFSELSREIALTKGLDVGELTVAVGPYPAEVSAHKAAGILSAQYPGVSIALRTTDWVQVVEDVLSNRVDLGFADVSEAATRPDLELELLRTSQLWFFCRAGHPLPARSSLDLVELMQFPWVGPTAPARFRAALPRRESSCGVFEETNGRFRPRILVDNTQAARDIVLASDALAVSLPFLMRDDLSEGRTALLPIELAWCRLNYGFIWRRDRSFSPAAKAFMELARAIEAEAEEHVSPRSVAAKDFCGL